MIISILQSSYLPWIGFFEQLFKCDIFVLYDDVQFDKGGWRNRNKIKSPNGAQWLTVPVKLKFTNYPKINEVKIDNQYNWRKKHLFTLRTNYSQADFYKDYIGIFEEAYKNEWEYLNDINFYFITRLAGCLGIDTEKIKRSSDFNAQGDRVGRLINLCKMFNADIFYEGYAGINYINKEVFEKEGVKVIFQDYSHPVYPQLYGEFIPYLSIVDLLFNCGPESLNVLMNCRERKAPELTRGDSR